MMKISEQVKFAVGGNMDLLLAWQDLYNHYRSIEQRKTNLVFDNSLSYDEKEDKFNAELKKLIIKRSGVTYAAEEPVEKWFNHPSVIFETFAIVGALIDMILPESIIETIGLYSNVLVGGWGDSFRWDVEPRDLFVVSKSGKAQRKAEVHKQFVGQVTAIPEFRELTVGVSLYKVLSGVESLASFANKAVRSLETQMSVDVYDTFATAMAALDSTATTGLLVSGYTQDALIDLCQRVTAWNQGAKAVVVGTQRALVNVLPDDANYRYTLDSAGDYIKLGYMRTIGGYDLMALPQVADTRTPWGTRLSNSYLWILSPSSQKLVKLCLEGNTLTRTDSFEANANLTMDTTFVKAWTSVIATNSVAGTISL